MKVNNNNANGIEVLFPNIATTDTWEVRQCDIVSEFALNEGLFHSSHYNQ